jgi:hypothetical protein
MKQLNFLGALCVLVVKSYCLFLFRDVESDAGIEGLKYMGAVPDV